MSSFLVAPKIRQRRIILNLQHTPTETGKYLVRKKGGSVRNPAQTIVTDNTVHLGLVWLSGEKRFRDQVVQDHPEKGDLFRGWRPGSDSGNVPFPGVQRSLA